MLSIYFIDMPSSFIYHIDNKRCNSCFKCVRECPFDAISFINHTAEINRNLCIDCGICFTKCPVNAIEYSNGVQKIKQLIKEQDLTGASLAPNWTSEFRGVNEQQMIEALKLLGIKHISPTAMGATASVETMAKIARSKSGVSISTTCPVVTATITNFYPHLIPLLLPTIPPHIAHAKMLRKIFGNEAKIVYISSCPAVYCNDGETIDITITFKELDLWLKEENVHFDKIPGNVDGYYFEPKGVMQKPDYIIPGRTIGDLRNDKPVNIECSGMEDVKKILDQLDDSMIRRHLFLDMFACRGGCVNGLFSINPNSTIDSKHYFIKNIDKNSLIGERPIEIDMKTSWMAKAQGPAVKQEDIDEIVNKLKIDNFSPNCGACGYDTCAEFAKGVVTNMTEINNCTLEKLRNEKSDKELFLEKLRFGVVFINRYNRIYMYNRRFVKIMKIEKMSHKAITSHDITEQHPRFKDTKHLPEKEIEMKINNKLYYVSRIALSNDCSCIIIRNIINTKTTNTEIEQRTKKTLTENMETMQKIAYLLGENASKVEAILRSFIEEEE
ncbi:MAG: [Fe-Fe] hydrogenase large subunit C-terminal domain-containing protein [Rikenellaceae bacterium]